MIDSIVFWGAGSKNGDRLTAIADLKGDSIIQKFISRREDDSEDITPAQAVRIEIVTQQAVVDAEGNELTPRETMAGVGLLISTDDVSEVNALWNLPDNVCRVQLNRITGKILRRRVTLAMLRGVTIEPMFLGSRYGFAKIDE